MLPGDATSPAQAEEGLVDESGGLERVVAPTAKAVPGDGSEFRIDQGDQPVQRGAIAGVPGSQHTSDVGCGILQKQSLLLKEFTSEK
jgi:hypothetical protein